MPLSLIFEGGGSLGLAYVGALAELDRKEQLGPIARVAGSSAGSIMALCIALGYKSTELLEIMSQYDFNKFKDDSWGIIRDTRRLFRRYGLYKGDAMLSWLRGLIKRKTGHDDVTFQELYSWAKDPIELVVTSTNLNKRCTAYWSVHHSPAMDVALAVRMSCSIPIMYKPVVFEGDIHVDGGVLLNYPIGVFDDALEDTLEDTLEIDNKKSKKSKKNRHKIIGLKIVRPDEQRNSQIVTTRHDIGGLYDFVDAIIKSMMVELERRDIDDDYWDRTVCINTFGISSTNFDLTDDEKSRLYRSGRDAMRTYLDDINNL